jgi:phosphoribosylanthranilate isomerase
MVQLHGSESPAYCARIPCRVVKVFSLPGVPDFASYQDVVSGFLVDTFHEKLAGGTGQAFDWSILDKIRPPGPLILAGGLGPDNVAEAMRRVHPFAVDVNSGVETAPGVKDIASIRQVVAEMRRADAKAMLVNN